MRMQLKGFAALIIFSACWGIGAQNNEILIPLQYKIGEIEIDLLGSYYEQEGNHSAVTGGEGTQQLTDAVRSIVVNIPIDTLWYIGASLSWDTYTSASTDMMDFVPSTESFKDNRQYGSLSVSRILKNGHSLSLGGGYSTEWDVESGNINFIWEKESDDLNRALTFKTTTIYDKWQLIYPPDMIFSSAFTPLDNDVRITTSALLSYAAAINKKLQASLTYEAILQRGLLSTPFHMVKFAPVAGEPENIELNKTFYEHDLLNWIFNSSAVNIEHLPDSRLKHAIAGRVAWYPLDWLILRGFYRYYTDDFGIMANTFSLEFPIKPSRFFSLYPFYRYHIQTGSKYFDGPGLHDRNEKYFTSDYDLSEFEDHKAGMGLKISPPFGIIHRDNFPMRNRTSAFKSIEIRVAKYWRSDGLNSWIISGGLSFVF